MLNADQFKEHLLSMGGTKAIIDEQDEQLPDIMSRGTKQIPRRPILMPGSPNQCHSNVCALHDANPHVSVHTGYALSDDGIWRLHSWAKSNGRIVETTAPRTVYFGMKLRKNELDKFKYLNS